MKEICLSAKMQLAQYEELNDTDKQLVDMAKDATKRSYAPYSHFHVGAALLMANGQFVIGCNQENAVFPAGLCAERTAIFSAQAQYPDVPIETLAIAARNVNGDFVTEPVTPCGSCRQVILEQECRLYRQNICILRRCCRTVPLKDRTDLQWSCIVNIIQ